MRARDDTKVISSQEHKKEQEEVRALVDSDPDGRPSHRQLWPCPGHGWKLMNVSGETAGCGLTWTPINDAYFMKKQQQNKNTKPQARGHGE